MVNALFRLADEVYSSVTGMIFMKQVHHASSRAPSTTTFLYTHQRQKTHQPYRDTSLDRHPLKAKTNLFASYLLKLWVPSSLGECNNFLPHYQPSQLFQGIDFSVLDVTETDLGSSPKPYQHVDPKIINEQWQKTFVPNLGALFFLNAFMLGKMTPCSLGLVQSPLSGKYFFTQKASSLFWSDYFKGVEFDFFKQPLSQTISDLSHQLVRSQPQWWAEIGFTSEHEEGVTHVSFETDLFLKEMMVVLLRILLTPDQLITVLFKSIFGTPNSESDAFLHYFQTKLKALQSNVTTLLYEEQIMRWQRFKKENGKQHYDRYLFDLSNYCLYKRQQVNKMFFYTRLMETLFSKAISLNLSYVIDKNTLDGVHLFEHHDTFLQLLGYVLNRIKVHANDLQSDATYFLWDILEVIGQKLAVTALQLRYNKVPNLFYHLLFTSIFFGKNDTAMLLFRQLPQLDSIVQDDWIAQYHPSWAGHSLLYVALQTNQYFANYLISQGAVLLSHEQGSLLPQPSVSIKNKYCGAFFSQNDSSDVVVAPSSITSRPRSNAFSIS
jgi:hypothetical protein